MTQAAKGRAILRGIALGVIAVFVIPTLIYFLVLPIILGAK